MKPEPPSPSPSPPRAPPERTLRAATVAALFALAAGLFVAGTLDRAVGGVLVVIAFLVGVGCVHRLGRAGAG